LNNFNVKLKKFVRLSMILMYN